MIPAADSQDDLVIELHHASIVVQDSNMRNTLGPSPIHPGLVLFSRRCLVDPVHEGVLVNGSRNMTPTSALRVRQEHVPKAPHDAAAPLCKPAERTRQSFHAESCQSAE